MTSLAGDIIATLAAIVMLKGILDPAAPGWHGGRMPALAYATSAAALTWLIARLWTLQFEPATF